MMILSLTLLIAILGYTEQLVLNGHNQLRSQLANGLIKDNYGTAMPRGSNIIELIYDDEADDSAQAWANKCIFQHSPRTQCNNCGQNLFMTTAQVSTADALTQAMQAWWSELADNGGIRRDLTIDMSRFSGIGHWSQMAWGNTSSVGCGVQWCPDSPMTIVVCNYFPAGNVIGLPVYTKGQPCRTNRDCAALTAIAPYCDIASGLCEQLQG